MFKLKLFLFLSKFIRYFNGIAKEEARKQIILEILQHLDRYENKDFKFGKPIFLPCATSSEIHISHVHKDIEFSFLLEYVKGCPIKKSINMTAGKFTDELKMISDYFEYFKKISDDQLLEFFKHI